MIDEDRLVHTFISLVKIDSETRFEQEISHVLQAKFEAIGLHLEEDATAGITGHGSGNLCGVLPATSSNEHIPTIFFTCHMDTVSPGKHIHPIIGADRVIRSDGTTILGSDDKAGIAALLEAMQVIHELQLPHGAIQIILTAGEEAGLKGARAMTRSQVLAAYGYALDSNGEVGYLASEAPGRAEISITFHGKSAHAGVNPEDGISAIQVASKAVARMPLGRIDRNTTANIGSFYGTGPLNVVCDSVTIEAEARSVDSTKLAKQIEAMRQACEEATRLVGATYEFHANIAYGPFTLEEDEPVVQLASRALRKMGLEPHMFATGGGSDANIFNNLGVPALNLAIGYKEIHTVNEHIAIDDLTKAASLVLSIIQETLSPAKLL